MVPGPTPFLLSSTFLKQIQAVIDTEEGTMWSKALQKYLVMDRSPKNLFLMDLNQLWNDEHDSEASCMAQTELSHAVKTNDSSSQGSLLGNEPKCEESNESGCLKGSEQVFSTCPKPLPL